MSRYFMIQSWVGSHENEPDYNGQQCGERNVRSSEVVPLYDQFGNANVAAFSDEAIAARSGKASQKKVIPLKNKVIPQLTRYNNLTEQMREIVAQYHAKEIDIKEYTLLMDITVAKRDKAKILLDKAMALKPVREETDTKMYKNFSSEPTDQHEQNVVNDVENPHRKAIFVSKIAGHSAVKDCIIFFTGSVSLLVIFKMFF